YKCPLSGCSSVGLPDPRECHAAGGNRGDGSHPGRTFFGFSKQHREKRMRGDGNFLGKRPEMLIEDEGRVRERGGFLGDGRRREATGATGSPTEELRGWFFLGFPTTQR